MVSPAEGAHQLLIKKHGLFLGYGAPDSAIQSVDCLQKPVAKVYPDGDKTEQVQAIDSWISIYSSGILVQHVARPGHKASVLWFPIKNLYVTAAMRCVSNRRGERPKFVQLSNSEAINSDHPTLFTFSSWREATASDPLLAYTFIVEQEEDALELVDRCELAYNNREGWGRDGEKPPDHMVSQHLEHPDADDGLSDTSSNSYTSEANVINVDKESVDWSREDRIFPRHLTKPYKVERKSRQTTLTKERQIPKHERQPSNGYQSQPQLSSAQVPPIRIPSQPYHQARHNAPMERLVRPIEKLQVKRPLVKVVHTPPTVIRQPILMPPRVIKVPVPVRVEGPPRPVPVVQTKEVAVPGPIREVQVPGPIQYEFIEKPVAVPGPVVEIPVEVPGPEIEKIVEKIVEVPVFVDREVFVEPPPRTEYRDVFVPQYMRSPTPPPVILQGPPEPYPVFVDSPPQIIREPQPIEVPVPQPYEVQRPIAIPVPHYYPVPTPYGKPYEHDKPKKHRGKKLKEHGDYERYPPPFTIQPLDRQPDFRIRERDHGVLREGEGDYRRRDYSPDSSSSSDSGVNYYRGGARRDRGFVMSNEDDAPRITELNRARSRGASPYREGPQRRDLNITQQPDYTMESNVKGASRNTNYDFYRPGGRSDTENRGGREKGRHPGPSRQSYYFKQSDAAQMY